MNIKYALSSLGLATALAGCSVDTKLYDGIALESIDERNLVELSEGSYRLLKNDNGLIDNGFQFFALRGDDVCWGGTSTGGTFDFYDYSRNVQSTLTEYGWELGYRMIGNCNQIIDMVEAMGDGRSEEETIIMGENYYLRGLGYFYLVNWFAQPYSNNPTQNPGLPLKLTSDAEDYPDKRSTVEEIYQQVVKDLKAASTYMTLPAGTLPKDHNHATKEAAQALLARVYLYMGDLDNAYLMADSVIQSGRFKLLQGEAYYNYPQHVPEDNSETIFAVRRTRLKDDGSYSRQGGLFFRIDKQGWEEVYASNPYLELLELNRDENGFPVDLRSKFVTKRYVEDGTNTDIYGVHGNENGTYNDWTFVYSRRQSASSANFVIKQISVTKQDDGTWKMSDEDAASFQNATIQEEDYNLGSRYYVRGTDGVKYIGRIEPRVYNANTLRQKSTDYLVYAINKFSYQEQFYHLWSPVVSRLAEMYLIRAEYYASKNQVQKALDDVNVLRRRAGVPEWTTTNMQTAEAGQPKDIMKIVEEERMLELAWEGHRSLDIFRKKGTLNRMYPGGHTLTVGDQFWEVPYNSTAVCEFIPQGQFDQYPYDLEQNP